VKKDGFLEIDVSFPIYLIGLMSFISWFLFVLFGGIGLTALPMDLIYIFNTRPKHMTKEIYEALKSSVLLRANKMKALGENLKQMESENQNLQKATSKLY
jgi:LMBR1 domain-containing protein 1